MKRLTKSIISVIALLASAILLLVILTNNNADTASSSFIHVNNKTKCKVNVAIDPGHGGILNNVYLTPGKQSPEWSDGLKIYEGYSNKLLATMLQTNLLENDIDAFVLNSDAYDYTNAVRAMRVNKWLELDKRLILISLHHNAQDVPAGKGNYTDKYGIRGYLSNQTGGATGIEVFTSVGKTQSDTLATLISYELIKEFPTIFFRADYRDKDPDKEANFTVLAQTKCPAVLIEFLFMTTFNDCRMIADDAIRERYIKALTKALIKYNSGL